MPLPIKEVLGILIDNLKIRNSVLPISKKVATKWAKKCNIAKGGETVIYTGLMYQIIPSITALVNTLEKMEGSFLLKFIKLGRFANKFINISKFLGRIDKKEVEQHNNTLCIIADLLKKAGVDFGYLYEDDLYVGALAYDLGADDIFNKHIEKVYKIFKKNNVKRVITTDPHTTNMLREIFSKRIPDFDIEVKSYLEVLVEKEIKPVKQLNEKVVIHDSCVYARHEGIIDEPRILLRNAGMETSEHHDSKEYTFCCGGPIESLFPGKAYHIGNKRIEQLEKAGKNFVVMCPVCYANLSRIANNKVKIEDIAHTLGKSYLTNQIE